MMTSSAGRRTPQTGQNGGFGIVGVRIGAAQRDQNRQGSNLRTPSPKVVSYFIDQFFVVWHVRTALDLFARLTRHRFARIAHPHRYRDKCCAWRNHVVQ